MPTVRGTKCRQFGGQNAATSHTSIHTFIHIVIHTNIRILIHIYLTYSGIYSIYTYTHLHTYT